MTPSAAELQQIVLALGEIALILEKLGVPGLVVLVISGPALVLAVILIVGFRRERDQNQKLNLLVATVQQEGDLYRQQAENLITAYRADAQQAIRELGENQEQTTQYYRDNVELVRRYEQVAKNLQDVVVSNTVAMTELVAILKDRRRHEV